MHSIYQISYVRCTISLILPVLLAFFICDDILCKSEDYINYSFFKLDFRRYYVDSVSYKNQWVRDNKDRINIVTDKGEKDCIKVTADRVGQSLNAYIVQAIKERMERDNNTK